LLPRYLVTWDLPFCKPAINEKSVINLFGFARLHGILEDIPCRDIAATPFTQLWSQP
jgi:hypothetical protein